MAKPVAKMRSEMLKILLLVIFSVANVSEGVDVVTTWTDLGSELFMCENGDQVKTDKICDGVDDCKDGLTSDECGCVGKSETQLCERRRIFKSLLPGIADDYSSGSGGDYQIFECIMHGYIIDCTNPQAIKCETGEYCVSRKSFCDGETCCPDGSDERRLGYGLKCIIQGAGHSDRCLLPVQHIYDESEQCQNGHDKCFRFDETGNTTSELNRFCFQCTDRKHVILAEQVCDGIIDCEDFSDECLCENMKTPGICELIYDASYDAHKICNLHAGDVSCGDGRCVNRSDVCDGKTDCRNGIDERFCYAEEYLIQQQQAKRILPRITCYMTEIEENEIELIQAVLCDGVPECDKLEDECDPRCKVEGQNLPPFCSVDLACVPGSLVCDGKWDSTYLCNKTIQEEEKGCPGRFYCDTKTHISIKSSLVCDTHKNCDDYSDESRDQNCTDDRFYCESNELASFMDSNRKRENRLFVSRRLTFDGRYDCDDGSDECPSYHVNPNSFSSRTEMISWYPLRVLLWINAACAFVGNLAVMVFSAKKLRSITNGPNTVAKCHHLLVLNLSLADFMMSIYLLILAVKSVQFSGQYCHIDKVWRMSDLCTAFGAISLISGEMSIIVMIIMAAFRFSTMYKPFLTFNSENTVKIVTYALVFGWIISTALAVIPLLESLQLDFATAVWTENPIFNSDTVDAGVMIEVAQKYKTLAAKMPTHHSQIGLSEYISTVTDVNDVYIKAFPHSEIYGWFGLYGQNSVCLPRLFGRLGERGWGYSFFLIAFNFIAFCSMVLIYSFMIKVSLAGNKNLREASATEIPKCRMQEKITRLLVTDFLCWIPICIIGFLFLSGVQIEVIVYAVCGIILLPINSALNPILYSGIYDKIYGKIKIGCCKRLGRLSSGKNTSKRSSSGGTSNLSLSKNGIPNGNGTKQSA